MLMKVATETDVAGDVRAQPAANVNTLNRTSDSAGPRYLTCADYIAADGSLSLRNVDMATYADAAPSGLFTHPAWLRAYGATDLLVVEGQTSAPPLIFTRERGGLFHHGRLLRFEARLLKLLSEQLLAQASASFVVFEDVDVVDKIESNWRRLVFRYQNNWRLSLSEASARMSKKLVYNAKRSGRVLARENAAFSIHFETPVTHQVLETIAAFGRKRIEGKGKHYGIDASEIERLAMVASEIGHGTIIRDGETILAADLVFIVGDQAYFSTHGHHPEYQKHGLGMMGLVHSIETCAERGLSDFHMLWGDGEYKQRVGGERIPLQTIVLRRSNRALVDPGYLATLRRFALADLKRRLKPAVARMREWKNRRTKLSV